MGVWRLDLQIPTLGHAVDSQTESVVRLLCPLQIVLGCATPNGGLRADPSLTDKGDYSPAGAVPCPNHLLITGGRRAGVTLAYRLWGPGFTVHITGYSQFPESCWAPL